MASNPGEIRLPRVAGHQRLVLVNRPEAGIAEHERMRCDESNHVPEARVPNEGLGYVRIFVDPESPTGLNWMWQCAFCGAERALGS